MTPEIRALLNQKAINQFLTVPNDMEGRFFLHLLDKYMNHDSYDVKLRGRTPDHKLLKRDKQNPRQYQQSMPLKYAKNIGVYIMAKFTDIHGKKKVTTTGVSAEIRLERYTGAYYEARNKQFQIRNTSNEIADGMNHLISEIIRIQDVTNKLNSIEITENL